MVRRNLTLIAIAALSSALLVCASAAEPPHYTFSPRPPGEITQSQLFYPAGEGMQSQWRAVASRVHLGGSAYQWYLSIYSIDYDTATYRLAYQSPRDGAPLSRVERASGGSLWFPLQSLHIVGAAALSHPDVQDLVVQSHEAGADCGTATVTIFIYDWTTQHIRRVASVENGCSLSATIEHQASGDAIRLAGPYYAPSAALCCPSKPNASAYLRERNGKWVESPSYYALTTP
ncbi:MAG TPA: hypothetical protein VIN40_04695 [Candidatus Tyrphobacter sp.]